MKFMSWKNLISRFSEDERAHLRVERVRSGAVCVEGLFELPPLARLSEEDQVFVAAFVRSHGSIREMERLFGISYPTVKNRLNKLSVVLEGTLGLAESANPPPSRDQVLELLERGEISVTEAEEMLKS